MSKILDGGRISSVRKDVTEFTSSIASDARLFDAVININKAHILMLVEQRIIKISEGATLVEALINTSKVEPNSTAEDIHMAIEEQVLNKVGPEIAGNLHIGKSRNDQVATAIRIELRKELLDLMDYLIQMQESLASTASNHMATVILGYTHLQPAQPVTFSHYLLSFFDALERDLKRFQETYVRINLCPMGAGALATTSFGINRERVATLLGFDDLLENSIDAVSSRDFILETLAVLILTGLDISRLAEDLIIWSSPDFGVIELPDEFTSTSSIMPQKKNPEILEVIRARTSNLLGAFVACSTILKGLPTTYNLDFQEITPNLWDSIETIRSSLNMFSKLIPNLQVSQNIATKALNTFSTATELANMLVRKHNLPFRKAHKIVGALVKFLLNSKMSFAETSPELLQKIGKETSAVKLNVPWSDISESIDPIKNVEYCKVMGGPSPSEVKRMLSIRNQRIVFAKSNLKKIKEKINKAEHKLQSEVESSLSSHTSKE